METDALPDFDTPEWQSIRNEKLSEWVGDRDAIEFLLIAFNAAEFFDDVVDGDKDVRAQAPSVLLSMIADLPLNPFFDKYKHSLIPLLIAGSNAWQDANVLEQGSDNDKAMAYVLRDWYMELLAFVVYLTRGNEYLRKTSLEMRRFFSQHETLAQYMRKL